MTRISRPHADADLLRSEMMHSLLDGTAKHKAPPDPDAKKKRPITLATLKATPAYLD